MMSAEVATTNFVSSMDIAAQASKLMQCVANGPATPTRHHPGPAEDVVDHRRRNQAARVDADVTIADPSRGVKGDSVVIIAVDTKPVTIFMGSSPIGDAPRRHHQPDRRSAEGRQLTLLAPRDFG